MILIVFISSSATPFNFQALLDKSGTIKFMYKEVSYIFWFHSILMFVFFISQIVCIIIIICLSSKIRMGYVAK